MTNLLKRLSTTLRLGINKLNPSKWYHTLLYAGTNDIKEYERNGVTVGINFLCISIILINGLAAIFYGILTGSKAVVAGALIEIFLISGVFLFHSKMKFESAKLCMFLTLNAATIYFYILMGQRSQVYLMLLFLIGLIMFVYKSWTSRFLAMVLSLYLLLFVELNFNYHIIPGFFTDQTLTNGVTNFFNVLVVAFLIVGVSYYYGKGVLDALHYERIENTCLKHSLETETLAKQVAVEQSSHKTSLMGDCGHELRTQFTKIGMAIIEIGNAIKENNPEESNHWTAYAQYFLSQATILSENLLSKSVIETGQLPDLNYTEFSLNEFLQIELNHWSRFANVEDRGFEYVMMEIGNVYMDKIKLAQIVSNLCTNAIKYADRGSSILANLFKGDDGGFGLSVENTGDDIPANKMSEIFLPYKTKVNSLIKPAKEGVGLGLAITKTLAGRMNGEITVESSGRKTRFTVYFRKPWAA